MSIKRRSVLKLVTGGVASGIFGANSTARPGIEAKFKAIAFDAFPIFDPRPIFLLAEAVFPGNGVSLSNEWRIRQFEYTWLRSIGREYKDFWDVTEDALVFATKKLKLDLDGDSRARLMNAYLKLKPWPDVVPALNSLKTAGVRLALLSNFTRAMLKAGIASSGLDGVFEQVLSTDQVRTYKPDRAAYQMALDAFRLRREEILFVAFAGWDAAGARWFGYPTFWMNRLDAPAEELGVSPDGVGKGLNDLLRFIGE